MFNTLVQRFGGLTDTTGKAIVDECGLEHFWESGVDIHDTSSSNAIKKTGGQEKWVLHLTELGITNKWIPMELPACQNGDLTHCWVKGYPTKEFHVIIQAPESSLEEERHSELDCMLQDNWPLGWQMFQTNLAWYWIVLLLSTPFWAMTHITRSLYTNNLVSLLLLTCFVIVYPGTPCLSYPLTNILSFDQVP